MGGKLKLTAIVRAQGYLSNRQVNTDPIEMCIEVEMNRKA